MNCFNTSNSLDSSLQLLNLIVSIPLFLGGLVCNAIALWVFCCKLRKWTVTTVFMMNLVISDLLVVLTFPFRMYAYMNNWDLGSNTCKILLLSYYMNSYMSIFSITAIAVDRYIAIKHPMKFRLWRSPAKAAFLCCVVWMLYVAVGVANILQSKQFILTTCFQKETNEPFTMALVFIIAGFTIPFIIISYCSVEVLMILHKKDMNDPYEKTSSRKAFNIIMSNLVVFVICFLPIHVGYTVRFVTESFNVSCYVREQVNVYMHVTTLVANSNCVLDSAGYFFAAGEFWTATIR